MYSTADIDSKAMFSLSWEAWAQYGPCSGLLIFPWFGVLESQLCKDYPFQQYQNVRHHTPFTLLVLTLLGQEKRHDKNTKTGHE